MIDVVSKRYAKALAAAVAQPEAGVNAADVARQLRSFDEVLAAVPEARIVLTSPAIAVGRKRAVVRRLSDQLGLPPLLRNFLQVVVDRNRVQKLANIVERLEVILDEQLAIVRVSITSAKPLPEGLSKKLEEGLSRITGKNVQTSFDTDPDLLGGVVAQIGGTVFDGSVRGQLDAMKQRLAAAEV